MECSSEVVVCLLTNFDSFTDIEIYRSEGWLSSYILNSTRITKILFIISVSGLR